MHHEARSFKKTASQQRPDRFHAVLPADFFAFVAGAGVIGDGDFVDAITGLEDFGGDLRFKVEADPFEAELLQNLGPEHLVRRFHVGNAAAEQPIRQPGQKAVRQPGFQGNMLVVLAKTGAVHHLGFPRQDGS